MNEVLLNSQKETIVIKQNNFGFLTLIEESKANDATHWSFNEIHHNGKTYTSLYPDFSNLNEIDDKYKKKREIKVNTLFARKLLILFRLTPNEESRVLIDAKHREISFIRIKEIPLYLSPTLSIDKKIFESQSPPYLPKIKKFTLASCFFGGAIIGIDRKGNKYTLIDHKLIVKDVIKTIRVTEELHPYEIMVFAALVKLFPLLKILSTSEFSVSYHLPKLDYILYGLHLFIDGKMSYSALQTYIDKVQQRGDRHKKIIQELARQFSINIEIESPFDNLFGGTSITINSMLNALSPTKEQAQGIRNNYHTVFIGMLSAGNSNGYKNNNNHNNNNVDENELTNATSFLNAINAFNVGEALFKACQEENKEENKENIKILEDIRKARREYEKFFVENILYLLKTKVTKKHHGEIWDKVINSKEFDPPKSLKELFRLANTLMILFATTQEKIEHFEVCAILPVDEKPIAIEYGHKFTSEFKHIISLFWLPFILNDVNQNAPTNNESKESNKINNPFRYEPHLYQLSQNDLISELSTLLQLPDNFARIIGATTPTRTTTTTVPNKSINNTRRRSTTISGDRLPPSEITPTRQTIKAIFAFWSELEKKHPRQGPNLNYIMPTVMSSSC